MPPVFLAGWDEGRGRFSNENLLALDALMCNKKTVIIQWWVVKNIKKKDRKIWYLNDNVLISFPLLSGASSGCNKMNWLSCWNLTAGEIS